MHQARDQAQWNGIGAPVAQHLEPESQYGGQPPPRYYTLKPPKSVGNWRRRRLNIIAIFICLFVPWLLFCFMSWLVSFQWFYRAPALCFLVGLLVLAAVLALGNKAYQAVRGDGQSDPEYGGVEDDQPTWYIFLFITCLLAWGLGSLWGYWNFFYRTETYYSINNLGNYMDVDPRVQSGEQLMDAGRVVFKPGTHLDLAKSMSFRNNDLYCVAPIVSANYTHEGAPESYDYWAVGVDCCCGDTVREANFQCGDYKNKNANAGLRLMRDDQRPFYRLAVQQAVGAYGLRANHPLFFYWVQDPISASEAYRWEGFRYYLMGVYSHFAFQFFAVCFAMCCFRSHYKD